MMKEHLKNNWLWYTIILILLGSTTYLYVAGKWRERSHRAELEKVQIECDTKVSTTSEQVLLEQLKNQSAYFASILQSHLATDDRTSVNEAIQNIVRKTLVTEVHLVDDAGKINASSISSREGSTLSDDYNTALLVKDDIIHVQKTDTGHTISVPMYKDKIYAGRLLVQFSAQNVNISPSN